MTVFRATVVLAAAVAFTAFVICAQPALAQSQSTSQKTRAESLKAHQAGNKRSFELDLSKMSSKRPQSQRTAGNAQQDWKKNHRTRNAKRIQGKKSMTRDQKNFGTLNR